MGSEVNTINPNLTKKLGLWVYKTKIGAQKIDGLKLDIFSRILASFIIEDKKKRSDFFEKTFLLADIGMDIILEISFFISSNVEIDLAGCHMYWKIYTIAEILLTTR